MTRVSRICIALLMVSWCPATSFSQTLTTKDAEHPERLVNTTTNTALRLRVIVPEKPLAVGTNSEIRVELHNSGYRIEVVYMPALTMRPLFQSDKATSGVDEFGLDVPHGRGSAKDEALNYVVLMGGDYYGRTYRWAPPAIGMVTFTASYLNREPGPNQSLTAWRGELRADSPALRIVQR